MKLRHPHPPSRRRRTSTKSSSLGTGVLSYRPSSLPPGSTSTASFLTSYSSIAVICADRDRRSLRATAARRRFKPSGILTVTAASFAMPSL